MSDIEKLLPEWEDFELIGRTCAQAKFEANKIKDELEYFIAECVKQAYSNQSYWINGKQPTQSYIEHSVKIMGNTREDAENIKRLNDAYRESWKTYEESRALLETMKDRISVFQTVSANKRNGL